MSASAWDEALDRYTRHLLSDRGFSEHTVRAYRGDLDDLAQFGLDPLTHAGVQR